MSPIWSYRREQTLVVLASEERAPSRGTASPRNPAPQNPAPKSPASHEAASQTCPTSDDAADTRNLWARRPMESSAAFEQRLRECLRHPSLQQSLLHAVLRCEPEWDDRTTLRRIRLVAALLKTGGSLTLSYDTPNEGPIDVAFAARLEHLAQFVSKALEAHHLTVRTSAEAHLTETPAPLAAAWHRLQRTRQSASSLPREASVPRRCITAHVAEQVTYALVCPPSPTPVVECMERSCDGTSPALVAPVVFPTVVPRR